MKSVVLLSGGLDSVTLAERERRAGRLVGVVFIDYAHPAQVAEGWKAFAYHGRRRVPLKVVHVFGLDLGDMNSASGASVVPARNLVLLSTAANVAQGMGAEVLMIGATAGDASEYVDCRAASIAATSAAFVAMGSLPVEAPFSSLSKEEVAAMARSYGISQEDVWSCYRGGAPPCGTCASCVEFSTAWETDGV